MAGLVCGRALAESGYRVTLFDKGRAPGGRLATRRRSDFHFDHGAQYFTARHEDFRRELDGWVRDGIAAEWRGRTVRIGPGGPEPEPQKLPRYVGVPGMSAIARRLAGGGQVHSGLRIARLERQGEVWDLVAEDGSRHGGFGLVIVATPADQAAPLLEASAALARAAGRAGYDPCWAVLLGFDEGLPVPWDAAEVRGGPIAWAARNNSKPGRPATEAWTVHCAPDWSRGHLEQDANVVVAEICTELRRVTGVELGRPAFAQAHRWRYAKVAIPVGQPCLFDADLQLGACGDWCLEGRVEAAYLSGAAMARRVLEHRDEAAFSSRR